MKRDKLSHTNLVEELKLYPEGFFNYLRMGQDTYYKLLELVKPYIERQNTFYEKFLLS